MTSVIRAAAGRVPPRARRWVRRVVDPVLAPIGSVNGARTDDPVLGLTFDDGPDPISTPVVLEALARHRARATFFVLADRAEEHPQAVRAVVAAGHEIGLHGPDHRRLPSVPDPESWLADGVRRLEAVAGVPVRRFRPPFGSQTLGTYRAARRSGLQVVVWAADVADWIDDPAAVVRIGLERARPGAVMLLHDAYAPDPAAPEPGPVLDRAGVLDALLPGWIERGYSLESVEGLLRGRRPSTTAWFRP